MIRTKDTGGRFVTGVRSSIVPFVFGQPARSLSNNSANNSLGRPRRWKPRSITSTAKRRQTPEEEALAATQVARQMTEKVMMMQSTGGTTTNANHSQQQQQQQEAAQETPPRHAWLHNLSAVNPHRLPASILLAQEMGAQRALPFLNPAHPANQIIQEQRMHRALNRYYSNPLIDHNKMCGRCGRPNHTTEQCYAKTCIATDMCHFCGHAACWEQVCPEKKAFLKRQSEFLAAVDSISYQPPTPDPVQVSKSSAKPKVAAATSTKEEQEQRRGRNRELLAMRDNNCGTYVLLSAATGQRYVGTSINIRRRIQQHFSGDGGAIFTKTLKRLRRVVPLPIWTPETYAVAQAKGLLPQSGTTGAAGQQQPSLTSIKTKKQQMTPEELKAEWKRREKRRRSFRIASTIDPLQDPHSYCDETRQTLAQMRAFGLDRVRGAAFCKQVHSNFDLFKLALMMKRERAMFEHRDEKKKQEDS